ncbi:MAG TPA: flagellar basal body L-ring protein FlgH [Syntrophales bacterium]|nr:flagellar basal body L-ring protein FlgH [Syntrophales bacterium]HOM06882.1 flagellar basal body L-ring protein FlgH [Syntrophales bacterium]HON99399.1 flagellar basal body L-ring protein FlgH [Syntrophales bacterium]HPC00564.1 flagellar basal body L-ring protein FlgH [Syntrophales bacterium]HPQ06423.1 flagellar basal body L-ring protein FlgH [Syntrophales bacterium]
MPCLVLAVTACASEHAVKKEIYESLPAASPTPYLKPAPGSLWVGENNRNMLFADNKARYVNDTITIIIDETSDGQNKASTNTSRASSTNASISALFGIDTSLINKNPNLGTSISAGGSSVNAMKGTGDTSRGNKLQARISGRVVRVLDNGNMVVEGRKQVTINAEDQYIVITGIVRPQDVSPENYVYSQNISDARIIYTGSGVVDDKSRPGWGTRILDWVWPF